MLDYYEWYDLNEEEVSIWAAESGVDREYDWDFDNEMEDRYELYLKSHV